MNAEKKVNNNRQSQTCVATEHDDSKVGSQLKRGSRLNHCLLLLVCLQTSFTPNAEETYESTQGVLRMPPSRYHIL